MINPSASGLWLPENLSAHGAEIDQTIFLLHYFMGALFFGWGAFFVYCLVRFRKGANPKASYEGSHSKLPTYLEVGVLVVEIVLLVFFSMPVWAKYKNAAPKDSEAEHVRVIAQQFAWNIHYPGPDGKFGRTDSSLVSDTSPIGLDKNDPASADDVTTINELNLPVDKPVIVELSSLDVIHSFFLPSFRVKQDAIPGMNIKIWFTATKTGHSEIACAQLCGLGHYRMRGFIDILTPEDYAKWQQEKQDELASGDAGYE